MVDEVNKVTIEIFSRSIEQKPNPGYINYQRDIWNTRSMKLYTSTVIEINTVTHEMLKSYKQYTTPCPRIHK